MAPVEPRQPRALPSQDVLHALLRYDPETGLFEWKERPRSFCKSDKEWRRWNRVYAGTRALTADCGAGYRTGRILGLKVKAHRVAWKYVYGVDPKFIDHANRDRSDNRIGNLRSVSNAENRRNFSLRKDNRTGVPNVFFSTSGKRYNVRVGRKWVGSAATLAEAASIKREAERAHGFHQNHGKDQAWH